MNKLQYLNVMIYPMQCMIDTLHHTGGVVGGGGIKLNLRFHKL